MNHDDDDEEEKVDQEAKNGDEEDEDADAPAVKNGNGCSDAGEEESSESGDEQDASDDEEEQAAAEEAEAKEVNDKFGYPRFDGKPLWPRRHPCVKVLLVLSTIYLSFSTLFLFVVQAFPAAANEYFQCKDWFQVSMRILSATLKSNRDSCASFCC